MDRKDLLLVDGNILTYANNVNDTIFSIAINKILDLIKLTDYKYTKIIILVNYKIIKEDNRFIFNEKLYKYIIKNNWDNLDIIDIEESTYNSADGPINYIISNPNITSFKLIGNINIKYSFIPENKIIKLEP